jgi:chemotaxis protein methyltransferase CheR
LTGLPGGELTARRAHGWSDPAFARVASVIHLVSGLVFPPNRQPAAESGMRRAMSSLGISDADALARAVQRPGESRDTVLAELTVGETYFFREPSQLALLGSHVLPDLRERRSADTPLRIWSAGCASGEEPYTIAILLREMGWVHPTRILGTDVARPRLEAARRARYTRWSMRGASEERVARWFERRGAQFQLDPSVCESVEFAPLNLIADDYPSAESGTAMQDVVLCRNVLIYFDMAGVEQIASRLLASLAPDGWLLLGASDPPLASLVPCEVMVLPGGIAYRRADRAHEPDSLATRGPAETPTRWWVAPAPAPPLPEQADLPAHVPFHWHAEAPATAPPPAETPEDAPSLGESRAAYDEGDYPRAEALAAAALEADAGLVDQWVLLVRCIANQGRLRDADQECVRALDLHRLSPELHYLHAMLLREAGQHRESANAARRALYLDPRFVMAHLLLGDVHAHLGDAERATRAFENALGELASTPAGAAVPAADGVPAERLRHVAEQRLAVLRTATRP